MYTCDPLLALSFEHDAIGRKPALGAVELERGAQEIDLELGRPPCGDRRFDFDLAATIDTQHHLPVEGDRDEPD
jgi:hypothetical protein